MEENFTMYDIADRLGWQYIQKSKGYIKCPFCGTEKLACNITDKYFNCFNCGNKGNYYTIYAELYGIQGKDGKSKTQIAARELRKMFGAGYVSRMKTDIELSSKDVKEIKKPIEELDKVYCELIRNTYLSDVHKKSLKERGFTDKQIEAYGFRSVDNAKAAEVCRILQKHGMDLKNVPGFYYDIFNGEWRLNTWGMDGFMCICPDERGRIQGFQIRLDKPKKGQKYLWLSSKDKYDGAGSGSPSAYFGNLRATAIVVVDGILKANICNCFNRDPNTAFVGVAGVNNHKNMRAIIERLVKRGVKGIYNAYDMDEFTNPICDEDYKESKCKNCPHKGDLIKCVCEHKKKKIEALEAGSRQLEKTAKELKLSYKRLQWDIGEDSFWQKQIKGLDDYIFFLKNERGCKNE